MHQPRLKRGQTCEALAGPLTTTLCTVVGGHHPWKIKFICWLFQKFFFPNLWLTIMPSKVLPKLSKYEILKTDTLMVFFSCWPGKSNFKIYQKKNLMVQILTFGQISIVGFQVPTCNQKHRMFSTSILG